MMKVSESRVSAARSPSVPAGPSGQPKSIQVQ